MRASLCSAVPLLVGTLVMGLTACADRDDDDKAASAQPATKAPTLAQAMETVQVSLGDALATSGKDGGQPISGKFELDDGHLQLSVYIAKDGSFSEVIVDHANGRVTKSEAITGGDDLAAAKQQAAAMARATVPLSAVVAKSEAANPGYKVVSAIPGMEGEKAMANLTLIKGAESKQVQADLR